VDVLPAQNPIVKVNIAGYLTDLREQNRNLRALKEELANAGW
jgi:ribosomal protein S17E